MQQYSNDMQWEVRGMNGGLPGSQHYEHWKSDYNRQVFGEPTLRTEGADGPDHGAGITGHFQLLCSA